MKEKKSLLANIKSKAGFIAAILITIFLTIVVAFFSSDVIHATGTPEFCGSCHEMDTFVKAYERDIHGGANRAGIKADCATCHLPQDSTLDYMATKVVSGAKEVKSHFVGSYSKKEYYENLKNREEFVYSSGCISCHKEVDSGKLKSDNAKAQKMHTYYRSKKGTSRAIECASCHIDVGHNGELPQALMDFENLSNEK